MIFKGLNYLPLFGSTSRLAAELIGIHVWPIAHLRIGTVTSISKFWQSDPFERRLTLKAAGADPIHFWRDGDRSNRNLVAKCGTVQWRPTGSLCQCPQIFEMSGLIGLNKEPNLRRAAGT
jgi:hypothetical protein